MVGCWHGNGQLTWQALMVALWLVIENSFLSIPHAG